MTGESAGTGGGKRAAGMVAAAVAGLGLASTAYRAMGEARDRREHPPPGRFVDVGGYRLHIVCEGQGGPPVVICPAIGGTADDWRDVQHRVAVETTVCVYDRAGLGYSDSPTRRRTATRMAEELHALLHGAGVAPPYVLAGHSMGGLVARVFIQPYPDEVAGLALIDSSHPEQSTRLPRTGIRDYPGGMLLAAASGWKCPLGLLRMASDIGLRKEAHVERACHRRASAAELLAFAAIRRETGKVADGLGDLPVTVLSANGEHAHPGYSREWAELQDELAALSTCSTHVEADHGGHHLNRDNPELVARVIADLVERVRADVGGEAR
jgi:pimeloyl-ACP methyl ester carboxylesterase